MAEIMSMTGGKRRRPLSPSSTSLGIYTANPTVSLTGGKDRQFQITSGQPAESVMSLYIRMNTRPKYSNTVNSLKGAPI